VRADNFPGGLSLQRFPTSTSAHPASEILLAQHGAGKDISKMVEADDQENPRYLFLNCTNFTEIFRKIPAID